jgi:hypothetical protein
LGIPAEEMLALKLNIDKRIYTGGDMSPSLGSECGAPLAFTIETFESAQNQPMMPAADN